MAESSDLYGSNVIATVLLVGPRRVQQMVKEGILTKEENGQYDLVKCVQDYIRFLKAGAGSEDINDAKRRKATADASISEVDLMERTGELVLRSDVLDAIAADFAKVRAHLLALPSKLAPQIIGIKENAVIVDISAAMINEALEELSTGNEGRPKGRKKSPKTAAKTNGKRVGGHGKKVKPRK